MAKPNKKQPVATEVTVGRGKKAVKTTVSKTATQRVIREGNKKLKRIKETGGIGLEDRVVSDAASKKAAKADMAATGFDRNPVTRRKGFTTSDQDYALSQRRIQQSQTKINVPGDLNKTQHDTLNKVTEMFKNSKPGSDRAEQARRTAGRVLQLGVVDPSKVSHHPCQTPKCPAIVSTRHDDVICKGCLEQEGGDVAGKTYTDRPSEYQKSYPV